ncbi:MAG: DNA/RNA non-specific endonuclease [Acidobacteriota bacterium]|nr:MAG: DNA/RNA non-specific endonuclease [Acidobacteriota bacterium]
MKRHRASAHGFASLLLVFLWFSVTVHGQVCSDCEIPASQRADRISAADQALTLADSDAESVRARHLPFGLPVAGSNTSNERLLLQFEWVAWYDDDLRMPLWVAYELTREDAAAESERQDCFRSDPRLSELAAAKCEDYEEPVFDRGHMIPRNDLNRSRTAHDNSFLFSNMAPQFPNFNRRVWRRLESKVHDWAIDAGGIYVITGAIFDRDGDGKRDADSAAEVVSPRNRVGIPTAFYKIVLHRRPNGVIDTIAFILQHNNSSSTNRNSYLVSKIASIDEIESVTGIDFFPDMDPGLEGQVEAGKGQSLGRWFTSQIPE